MDAAVRSLIAERMRTRERNVDGAERVEKEVGEWGYWVGVFGLI